MLKLDNESDFDALIHTMNALCTGAERGGNYIEDVLRPAIKEGDWVKLNEMIVYQDGKKTIRFREDDWFFSDTDLKCKSACNLQFSLELDIPENVIMFNSNSRQLINEIKCLALTRMYFSKESVLLATIRRSVMYLRNNANALLRRNISSFGDVTNDTLRDLVSDGVDFTYENAFVGLNALHKLQRGLPFKVQYDRLTHSSLNLKMAEGTQFSVIPPRLYFSIINQFSAEIEKAYALRDEIEKSVEKRINLRHVAIQERIKKIRNGKSGFDTLELRAKSTKKFLACLESEGISLVDNEKDERWMQRYYETKPCIREVATKDLVTQIGGKSYSIADFKRYLHDLNDKAAWYCLLLTGMRVDELSSLHPDFGAQKVTINNENGAGKEIIYLLTTRQSKITMNSQKKDDVYVTNLTGYKAFHVLNAINYPYRSRFSQDERYRMFAKIDKTQWCFAKNKSALTTQLIASINGRIRIDPTLTREDIEYLNVSEKKHNYSIGDTFHITNHQSRRSLAYYLVGYELCSFPALKQQLSHFSIAMTRWYSRNASSYRKFWNEVNDERIEQKADIYVRIFKQMANGERIAGGKGKTQLQAIAKSGTNYFKDGVNKRLLTKQYWKEMLTNKKEHLHAIATGMYCTNNACSMRISIDLTECVSCEYDYIENAVYAESSRMDAMRNLNLLIEMKELNPSSATRCYMQIKAAERIMTDLNCDHEPYEFTQDVMNMIIHIEGVA